MKKPYSGIIWNPIELFSHQELTSEMIPELLVHQLNRAKIGSPFYRKKLVDLKIPDKRTILDLYATLPFTDKSELLADQQQFPPFGSNLPVRESKIQRINRTSGTTSEPLLLILTSKDVMNTYECGARCFYASGLRRHHTVIHCMNYCMWAGGYTDHGSLEHLGAAVIPFGVGNSRLLIETILRIRPQALHATPSYLTKLQEVLNQDFGLAPIELGLQLGLFGGEAGIQDSNFRRQIEKIWGFKAMNANYGSAEVLSMFGAECHERAGLHFMGQGVLYPTLIDMTSAKDIPITSGAVGELVLTTLVKQAQPLIRYRTHDLIEILSTDRCLCGRGSFRFKVIGRNDDMIIIKGINVFPTGIQKIINENLDYLNGQYVILINKIDPIDRFVVRAEVRPEMSEPRDFRSKLQSAFVAHLAVRPEIELIAEGTLPRTENKTKRLQRIL